MLLSNTDFGLASYDRLPMHGITLLPFMWGLSNARKNRVSSLLVDAASVLLPFHVRLPLSSLSLEVTGLRDDLLE